MTLFRIRRQHPLPKTLRKVFAELIARVERELSVSPLTAPAVHEARKSVKRLRAIVSLVAIDLGKRARDFDRTLRDVNRVLSATRDATVAIATFENLALNADEGLSNDLAAARAALDRRLAAFQERDPAVGRDVLAPLKRLLQRWKHHQWPHEEWTILEPNLRQTYRKGRRLYRDIAAGAPAIVLHELRKLVKQTQYQLEFLLPMAAQRMQTEHDEWEHLADVLGEHHNLWVLEELIRTTPTRDLSRISRSLVLNLIRDAAHKLERKVARAAPILYAERPRAFADRLRAYWKHWRSPLRDGR